MKKGISLFIMVAGLTLASGLLGDVGAFSFRDSSDRVNEEADKRMYRQRSYDNAGVQGPLMIVLPGEIKSNNATFRQKITNNNIRDFAEVELANANFRVLERGDLNPMLGEQKLAAEMGSQDAGQFGRGKFRSTRWFVRFDILKAEPVASASRGFDGTPIGNIAGAAIHSRSGSEIARTAGSSIGAHEEADIWVVGLRYKVIDASTSEQVTSGYMERKMEHNANAGRVLGFSSSESKGVTLDTMVQLLVQDAVSEMARMK
jgi:curli biogenesis system outer membrane secretion channel CsgG